MNDSNNSIRKAAILIASLDTRSADDLLDQMGETLSDQVREAVMNLEQISEEEERQVIDEFVRANPNRAKDANQGVELDLSSEAAAADGHQQTSSGLDTNSQAPSDEAPFQFLYEAEGEDIAPFLRQENPQTIAVVLAHLPPRLAADTLARLDPHVQTQVTRRIVHLGDTDPVILADIASQLDSVLSDQLRKTQQKHAGLSAMNEILNAAETVDRGAILQNLAGTDQQLADQLHGSPVRAISAHGSTHQPSRRITRDPQTPMLTRFAAAEVERRSPTRNRQADQLRRRVAEVSASKTSPSKNSPSKGSDPQNTIAKQRQRMTDVESEFANLARLADHDLALLLQRADSQIVLLALTGAKEEIFQRITKQLPDGGADELQRRIETQGPIRLSDIEYAQKQLTAMARKLASEGIIETHERQGFAVAV